MAPLQVLRVVHRQALQAAPLQALQVVHPPVHRQALQAVRPLAHRQALQSDQTISEVMVVTDGFAMELCGAKGSYQIVPEGVEAIDLEKVGTAIEAEGYEVGVRSRLCWTFTGPCDLTLYPSGKLMVRTEDKALAEEVAKKHVSAWVQS